MKKINKLFFVLIFVYLTSCVTETENQRIDYNFEITNNSSKSIRILSYKDALFIKETGILNSSIIEKSFTSFSMDRAYSFSDVLGGDSIKIIYDNAKFKTFYCLLGEGSEGCNTSRNILSVFEDNDDRDNVVLNKFTFTESDYENAEDCNGNCD